MALLKKGCGFPTKTPFGSPESFSRAKDLEPAAYSRVPPSPRAACGIESLGSAVASALTTADKPALPSRPCSSCSCPQPCFKLLVIQAVGSKTCFEFPEMHPFLKWPCLCATECGVILVPRKRPDSLCSEVAAELWSGQEAAPSGRNPGGVREFSTLLGSHREC